MYKPRPSKKGEKKKTSFFFETDAKFARSPFSSLLRTNEQGFLHNYFRYLMFLSVKRFEKILQAKL